MVIPTCAPSRVDDAAGLLVGEAEAIDAQIQRLENELSELKDRKSRLIDALRHMRESISKNMSGKVARLIDQNRTTIQEFPARSEKVIMLLKKIRSEPLRSWNTETIKASLGQDFSEKYTANTMRRLHEEGLLVRVSRGLYRASDHLVAIEGLTEEDLE
jgi:hypothetical protein